MALSEQDRAPLAPEWRDRLSQLTPMQIAVLRQVYAHQTSKDIARLSRHGALPGPISPGTVDYHCERAMQILGVGSRREAARLVMSLEVANEWQSEPLAMVSPAIGGAVSGHDISVDNAACDDDLAGDRPGDAAGGLDRAGAHGGGIDARAAGDRGFKARLPDLGDRHGRLLAAGARAAQRATLGTRRDLTPLELMGVALIAAVAIAVVAIGAAGLMSALHHEVASHPLTQD